jgi:DNA repair protein RadC
MAIKTCPRSPAREKLLARGPAALADAELLAILLRTGIVGKGVLQMAQELLDLPVLDPPAARSAADLAASPGCCTPAPATWNASRAWAPPSAPSWWRCWSWRAAPGPAAARTRGV